MAPKKSKPIDPDVYLAVEEVRQAEGCSLRAAAKRVAEKRGLVPETVRRLHREFRDDRVQISRALLSPEEAEAVARSAREAGLSETEWTRRQVVEAAMREAKQV